ncbi:MAG: hypothetical protein AABZ35_07770 [Gemmatimonadota bacterium]
MIPLPANFIVRWRWPIVVVWALFAALMVPVASELQQRLQVGGQNLPNSESTRAEEIVRDRIGTPFANFVVVAVRHASLTLDDPAYAVQFLEADARGGKYRIVRLSGAESFQQVGSLCPATRAEQRCQKKW